MRPRLREEWAVFLLALQFLTRLPLPRDVGWTPARMAATPRWYPGIGLLVGGAAGAVFLAAALALPPLVALLLSTAAGIGLTGAFHEDGLADACDGLGGATAERALAIMRDSRIGSYGALGLGLVLALKVAALAHLPVAAVPLALVAGHGASRASSVVALATGRYLREHGTGKPVADGLGGGGLVFALACGGAGILVLWLVLPAAAVAGGVLALVLAHGLTRRAYGRKLGGYTGDCLGAVQQTGEAAFYVGLLLWL